MVAVTAGGVPGSGYVVGPRLVLTSAHVVGGPGAAVEVFHPGRAARHEGVVVWCGTAAGRDDAALVRVDSPAWVPPVGRGVAWGRVVTERPGLRCEARGVPDRAQRPGGPVDTAQVSGTLNPDDLRVANRHVLAVEGHRPDPGGSPWGGLSGAAVFAGGLLIGVVMADEADSGHTRLVVVPSYVLHHDERFRAALAEHGGESSGLRPVEFEGLADPGLPVSSVLPSPGWLLHPALEVVPFRGRRAELDRLAGWAAAEGFGVCLVHGPGGQGKTRLARQFAADLGRRWATVWLDPRARGDDLAVLADAAVPTLVVVDYAETRAAQVEDLVRVAVDHGGGTPLKVFLLARTAGEWWDRLRASSGTASLLLDGSPVVGLDPLESEQGGQESAYRDALEAFAAELPKVRGLSDRRWAGRTAQLADRQPAGPGAKSALTLHMTALAHLLDSDASADADGPLPPEEVEDRLVEHEKRYWEQAAAGNARLPLRRSTLHDAMAAAVLVGADDRDQADALLLRVVGLADQPRDRRDAVVDWIAGLYPAADTTPFGMLQPDRLAERFVGRHLEKHPELADRLVPGISPQQAERLLTLYARAAAHTVFAGALDEHLTALCVRHPPRLGGATIAVATQVERPQPLLLALEHIGDASGTDVDLLSDLANHLPPFSHRLTYWAALLGARLVDVYRAQAEADPDTFTPDLAMSLNNQANRLADLGRREEALKTNTEAVRIYLKLALAKPDAFHHALATSLNNQAGHLAGLGRHEEALKTIALAVAIRRPAAQARPEIFTPDLAMTLNNQAVRLAGLGRREEALEAITRAVTIRRELARTWPEAFNPDLAMSLNNKANHLAGVGRREEALQAVTEAVGIYRELARTWPDAFDHALATSLNNQSVRLAGVGRREEALEAVTEAVTIRRDLVRARPDAFNHALATSLNNQAVRLADLGRRAEALEAVGEAVEIYRELAGARPDVFRADLAVSLNNLANTLADLGRREDALKAISEAVEIYRELAGARPDVFRADLAVSLNNLANTLADQGRHEEALEAVTEAVAIRRELADARPDAFNPNLALSLHNQSVRLAGVGRRGEALEAVTEAVTIRRDLARARPDAFNHALAASLNNQAVFLADLGRREEALAAITEAITIRRSLVRVRPQVHKVELEQSLRVLALLTHTGGNPVEATD